MLEYRGNNSVSVSELPAMRRCLLVGGVKVLQTAMRSFELRYWSHCELKNVNTFTC